MWRYLNVGIHLISHKQLRQGTGSRRIQVLRGKSCQPWIFYLREKRDFHIHQVEFVNNVNRCWGWECPSRVWRRARPILLVDPTCASSVGLPGLRGGVRACGSFLITLIATETRLAHTDREKTVGHLIWERNPSDILSEFLSCFLLHLTWYIGNRITGWKVTGFDVCVTLTAWLSALINAITAVYFWTTNVFP